MYVVKNVIQTGVDNMNFENMKAFMDRLTSWRIPGNTISVYHENKEIFRYSSGYADVENKVKMTGDEILNIYSCTKVSTVTAALQLYERGYFLLDDPVYDFIPEFKEMYVRDAEGELVKADRPITMRQLLTHTSGMDYNLYSQEIKDLRAATDGKMPTLEFAKLMAKAPLIYQPGTKWQYSKAHDVLGGVIEAMTGKKFGDYVKENIFYPIGITDIHYQRTDDVKARMACQYTYKTEGEAADLVNAQISSSNAEGVWVNIGLDCPHVLGTEYEGGGAGLAVAVPEYAKFASCLANGGVAPNGEKIISAATIELLRTNQLDEAMRENFNWSQLKGYGFGLGVRTMIDKAAGGSNGALGEFGWGGAAGATLLADPDNRLSIFYSHHMCNPQEDYYQPRLRNVLYGCFK